MTWLMSVYNQRSEGELEFLMFIGETIQLISYKFQVAGPFVLGQKIGPAIKNNTIEFFDPLEWQASSFWPPFDKLAFWIDLLPYIRIRPAEKFQKIGSNNSS